jgi:hypothetical protein
MTRKTPRAPRDPKLRITLTVAPFAAVSLVAATASPGVAATRPQDITPTTAAVPASSYSLKGVCPSTVTVQTDWTPEVPGHFALFELASPNGTVNVDDKSYTAPLIAHGHNTGVNIQILTGGAVIGFQSGGEVLREHSDVLLAEDSTDTNLTQSATSPLVDLIAPDIEDPQGIMWSPQVHPTWKNIADIGKSSATIIVSNSNQLAFDYLISKGIIQQSQLVKSYTGSPAQFIAAGGQDAQQDIADNEPWQYEHSIKQWLRPVDSEKISDYGYDPYDSIGTLPSYVNKYAACFTKLIPDIQQGIVDYVANPGPTNALIVKLASAYGGVTYPLAWATWAGKEMLTIGAVANSPDGAIGSFDLSRVTAFLQQSIPLTKAQGITTVRAGITANELVTNRFIDLAIHLPAGE